MRFAPSGDTERRRADWVNGRDIRALASVRGKLRGRNTGCRCVISLGSEGADTYMLLRLAIVPNSVIKKKKPTALQVPIPSHPSPPAQRTLSRIFPQNTNGTTRGGGRSHAQRRFSLMRTGLAG